MSLPRAEQLGRKTNIMTTTCCSRPTATAAAG